MFINSISTSKCHFIKPTNRIVFRANYCFDTFEKSAKNLISPNEVKTLITEYLEKHKNILNNLSDKPIYKLSIKEKLLDAIKSDKRNYFFGDNPECEIDNIDEYYNSFKNVTFDEKINLMTNIANKNNGKYLNFWRSNPEILLAYVNSNAFVPFQIKTFSDKTWDIMIASLVNVLNSPNFEKNIKAVLRYSNDNGYQAINTMLRLAPIFKSFKEIREISKETLTEYYESIWAILNNERSIISDNEQNEKFIKNSIKDSLNYLKDKCDICISTAFLAKKLNSYIENIENYWKDTNITDTVETLKNLMISINEDGSTVHLLRTSELKELDELKINGMELHKNLKIDDLIPDVINKMNKNESVITHQSFISTSIFPHIYMKQPVNYSLTLNNNVKCLYLSDIMNIFNKSFSEAELLLHPNALININFAEMKNDKLYISGTVSNNNYYK